MILSGDLDNLLGRCWTRMQKAQGLTGTGPFNLGRADDYRVPDRGYHRVQPRGTCVAAAVVVFEIISPDDETYETCSGSAPQSRRPRSPGPRRPD
ncbi:MAG: hypothetical protein ACRD12_14585 [Acidimicrobiales bacterium]